MHNSRITVRLDEITQRRLHEEVLASGKNESDIVRAALQSYFARSKRRCTALEVARRAGVIGCADGLPADLSTSKKHYEGFGR